MRIDRELETSFIISFLLHILIFLIFNVTLFSNQKFNLNKKIEISFFGPLLAEYGEKKEVKEDTFCLKKDTLFFMEREKSTLLETPSRQVLYVIPEKPYREIKRETILERGEVLEKSFFSYLTKDGQPNKLSIYLKDISFPELSYIFRQDEEDLIFKYRLYVSEEGRIEFVEPLFFSGNLELDIFMKKAVKESFFYPLEKLGKWYEIEISPQKMAKK